MSDLLSYYYLTAQPLWCGCGLWPVALDDYPGALCQFPRMYLIHLGHRCQLPLWLPSTDWPEEVMLTLNAPSITWQLIGWLLVKRLSLKKKKKKKPTTNGFS
ncbi:hypothetical protein ACKS23_08739 [Histoplasma ohiense]